MKNEGKNFINTLKGYKINYLKKDFSAGLSVASLSIPQNMAYALIAGLNPIYGLYTTIISKVISSLTGTSNYMIVGPTNLMAMAIASNLSHVQDNRYLETVIMLTFLVGVFQILAGVLKLGKLVRYVSHPVIVGLTTGAAIIIGVGQINNLLGVSIDRTYNVYMELYNLILNLSSINFISLILGLTTILIIIVAEKSIYKIPSYLLGVLIVTIIVMLSGFNNIINTVGYINLSEFKISIPPLKLNLILNLSTKSLAVAIVGLIQTLAVVKSISHRSNEELDINKEFISQGFMNFGLSFFNGFASSASFTNTFANYQRGAKTRISELLSAIAILFFIIFFNFFIKYIPISSLAALVLLVAYNMIDISEVKELIRATKADTLVFIITFIATISSPRIEYAVYLGVILSLISVLKNSSEPKVDHLIYDEKAHSKLKKTAPQEIADDEYLILDMVGDFNFSSAENFKEKLENVTEAGCGYVLRLRNIDNIDITTINELKRFIKNVQNKDREVLISGINQKKYKILKNLGIIDLVGEDNIFYENANILSSTVDAVEKADKNIKGQNDDVS
ncbi:MAG: SulP family inorganic anion transporter [Halanaerobiales bacterium]|nr:SulP family inorganic anion transporter [Halanaerobiales bacterium]